MPKFGVSTWKPIPFLRILIPLIAGILLQYHLQQELLMLCIVAATGMIIIFSSQFLSTSKLFLLRWMPGIGINLLFLGIGAILVTHQNIENRDNWIGNNYQEGNSVVVTILEPLVEKPKSYKALAAVESVITNERTIVTQGNILVYFQKDSLEPPFKYGTQLLVTKPLQRINNSGNPGGFDYKRYCAFQDIYYQAFLKPGDYVQLKSTNTTFFKRILLGTSSGVLNIIRKYITSKNETAVAEALLIGYRDDLDKELVQSYSNTGVVHIIAISGLHLGMIYGALVWIFALFKKRKWNRITKPVVILFVLWAFTFIAGAVPSILRSAVMFTCIILGESINRKTSVYNTLACSAFLLLLYNPFYLWDVGFQLSYAAVLSIIAFQKYLSNWFYFQNKILSGIWKLAAISLAAQVLTLPVVLYHFHQFPNLFLLTNLIVVPLSGVILFAEIILLLLSPVTILAKPFGIVTEWMIRMMNLLIERTDRLPFAVTDGIQISIVQTVFIFGTIIFLSGWLINKQKRLLAMAGFSILVYFGLRSVDLVTTNQQQKLIVYNVPRHTAIDILERDRYIFYGDAALEQEGFLRNFHLQPSRIANRVSSGRLKNIVVRPNLIRSAGATVIILDKPLPPIPPAKPFKANAIIITGNPRLYIYQLRHFYQFDLLVFDATNPNWKIQLWKKDCDSLHLRHYSVPEKGAFEMNL